MVEDNLDSFKELAEGLKQHTNEAFKIYKVAIDRICVNKVQDEKEIEQILDHLVSYCFDDKMLLLYKKLCRYYYAINPTATFEHINIYREMWDVEPLDEK
jgi:hypothetical protein